MKIIAELGINHGGNPETAEEMIVAAADAGVDGVKLQTYRVGDFLPEGHEDWDMFEACEIWPHLNRLVEFAHEGDLQIGTTPTSVQGVAEAVAAGVDFLKNGSDFLLRHNLIQAMVDTGLPTWVSTGMASEAEIEDVPFGAKLMACTSLYPCPQHLANVSRLNDGIHTGYSDHTRCTLTAPICAVLGAEMYETHFTLDPTMKGPDHTFSRTPNDLGLIVSAVRTAESLLGTGWPDLSEQEQANRDKWRVTEGKLRG